MEISNRAVHVALEDIPTILKALAKGDTVQVKFANLENRIAFESVSAALIDACRGMQKKLAK